MSRLIIADTAFKDLLGILAHIAQDSGRSAARMNDRFTRTFEMLAESPRMGRPFGNPRLGLRRFNEGEYAIIHREIVGGVEIARVVHGRRNLEVLFDR